MKKILILGLLLLFPTLALGQGAGTPVINQTDIGPGDCSGTITTGGTAQNAFAASKARHGFLIYNLDTTEPLWINFNGTAVAGNQGSYPLTPPAATSFTSGGSFYTNVGFNIALSIVAATTGHKYSCTVW